MPSRTPQLIVPLALACLVLTGCPQEGPDRDEEAGPDGSPTDTASADTASDDTGTDDTATADTAMPQTDSGTEDTGGSDAGGDTSQGDAAAGECVPSRSAWDTNVADMVDKWCGECHGESPKFGAPYPLVDYEELVAGAPGERKVDKMATRLLADEMPPPSADQPDHTAEDTLVEWATCGEKHPDHSKGVNASAPPMDAPEDPPANAKSFDITADNFELGQNELNRYQCFTIDAPFESERFIRRLEMIVDDDRVLHHALLAIDRDGSENRETFKCSGFPPGDGLLYGWAPGQAPIQFQEGGVRVNPGAKFVLQIHYNNGAGATDVKDSSGVRIHHVPSASPTYTIAKLGPEAFAIPPHSERSHSSTCTVQSETDIVASFPHMHEIGSEFHSHITRKDGSEEQLIDLTGWSFESQLFYRTPKTLKPGDKITTECVFDNDQDRLVTFGLRTEDEMCYNFAYVTPPDEHFCQ